MEHTESDGLRWADNSDTKTWSLQRSAQIREYADDAGIPGLLGAGYRAPTGDQA